MSILWLSDKPARRIDDLDQYGLTISNTPYAITFFTKSDVGSIFETLLKLRYHDVDADWTNSRQVSRVIGREILRGHDILMKEDVLDEWLTYMPLRGGRSQNVMPRCA